MAAGLQQCEAIRPVAVFRYHDRPSAHRKKVAIPNEIIVGQVLYAIGGTQLEDLLIEPTGRVK